MQPHCQDECLQRTGFGSLLVFTYFRSLASCLGLEGNDQPPLCANEGTPTVGHHSAAVCWRTGQSLICKLWLRCPSACTLAIYSGSRFILTHTPPTPCSVEVVKLPCWLALQTFKRPPLSCMATVALTPEKRARLLLPRDLRLTCAVASGIFSASGGMDP